MTDIIFESFINLFQSVVVTVFLIISLGCKDKYNKKCTGIIGIVITFIYLTVSNHIVFFFLFIILTDKDNNVNKILLFFIWEIR